MFNGRKIEEKNKLAKQKSINMVEELKDQSARKGQSELASELNGISRDLAALPDTRVNGVLENFYKIIRYLGDLRGDFNHGFFGAAKVRTDHIKAEISKIQQVADTSSTAFRTRREIKTDKKLEREFRALDEKYASSTADEAVNSISVDELYTSDDLFEIVIRQKQDEVDKYTGEIEKLTEQLMEDPGNVAISSTLNNKRDKKQTAETILENYAEARKRGSTANFMNSVSEEARKAMAMAGISDKALQEMYNKYQVEMQEFDVSTEKNNDIRKAVMGDSSINGAKTNSFVAGLTGNTNTSSFSDAGSVQSVKPNGIKEYNEKTLTEMLAQANVSLKFYQKQREKMQEQFDAANSKLGSLSAQTIPMLEMYDDIVARIKAGEVELNTSRMKYEQDLKKKQRDIESAKNSMDRSAQDLDRYDKDIAIFEDYVETIKSQLRDNQFRNISGAMAKNLDDIAMILRKSVQERNKDFEHVNDLYNVARGEGYNKDEFNMNVSSLNDGIEGDKFKELRKFLGRE